MRELNIDSVTILRAATADEESLRIHPATTIAAEPIHGTDLLSDVALRACSQLLSDIEPSIRDNIGLVIGTAFGCLETDRIFDRSRREANGRYASPAAFARTLPSTVAAEIALKFSLRGPSLVVSSGATSTSLAIARAMRWMEHFNLKFCIAGGMDWFDRAALNTVQKAPKGLAIIARGEQREPLENDPANSDKPQRRDRTAATSCVASLLLLTHEMSPRDDALWRIQRTSLTYENIKPYDDDLYRLAHWIQSPKFLNLSNGVQFTHHSRANPADQ